MIVPDAERWKRLSPLLDGLLDLEPAARAARLDALRAQEPALAGELAALIGDAERAEHARFLAGSVAPASARDGTRDGDASASLVGERIGAYVIDAPLGQGGTGTVWRAHRADGRYQGGVAVKLLHLSLVGRTGALRFEREGGVLARLSHPHIAHLLDAGVTAGGQPFLVLELVEGERIDRHCDAGQLGIAQRVALFRIVLAAVAHAHSHLVIHRDIKPGNILVDRGGQVKLLDFGIAKLMQGEDGAGPAGDLTGDGLRALTPDYAAPEQLRGEAVSTATDVYSLGVLLYQLLTGRHPTVLPNATPADSIRAALDTDPSRLSTAVTVTGDVPAEQIARIAGERDTSPTRLKRQLGGDLENIVAKALRKLPTERYATVDAFAEDLRRWAAGEPVTARADSVGYRASRFVGRHRGKVAAAALTFAAILAGLVGTITQAQRAQTEGRRAAAEAASAIAERDSAVQQATLQRGTNEFLQLLMREAAGGDPDAIRKQLDRAAELIDRTRFEAPIVKIALLRQIAGRYGELGDITASTGLVRKAMVVAEGSDLGSARSVVPINLACSLARYLSEGDDQTGAITELDRADRQMTAASGLTVPARVECRVTRAYADAALGHVDRAASSVRQALQELEASGIRAGEQHRIVRGALAAVLASAGRPTEGMAVARPVLEESTAAQGRTSMGVLRRSDFVTRLTRSGGDPLAALALSDADTADAARLQAGRTDATISLERGRVLLELGRAREAAMAFEASAAAARRTGRGVLFAPAALGQAEALLAAGDASGAATLWAGLAPLREKLRAESRPERVDVLRVEARLAAAANDAPAAIAALDAAQAIVDGSGPDARPLAFRVSLQRGEQALAAGAGADAALANADRALAAAKETSLDAARSSSVGRSLWLRARALEAAGRHDDARRDAAEATRHLVATLGAAHPDAVAAQALAVSK